VATHDFIIMGNTLHNTARRAAINAPNGLSPAIVRQAYGINQLMFGSVVGDGSGQTIAIVDAYNAPTIVSDLHAFDTMFGLPDPALTRINQSGGSSLPGNDPSGRGNSWAVETSLDVEWAHAVAPKARIILVEATSATNANLMAAVNTARRYAGVSVVSMSWGGDETSSNPLSNSAFTTPSGHNGVTFVAASGDSGAYGFNGVTTTVGYPAASPNVLAVGGTSLNTDASGNYISESGWGNGVNSAYYGGSGGGISRYETQPTYQKGVVTQSISLRALPDVAFLADPNTGAAVVDSWDFGNTTPVAIGGTSLAAPMWAGVIALANQDRALSGLGALDGVTQTLPRLYALPSSDFHDITTGNNGYAAGPGFDLVTGRGTPIVNKLVPDLASATGPAPAPATPGIGAFAVNPTAVVSGSNITLTATNVTETSGTVSTVKFYRETNGQAGLQIGSDALIGTGVKNGTTWTITTSTTGLAPGTYTYYAVATDAVGLTTTASTTLTVLAPAAANDNFANGTVISGTAVTATGTNVNATKEPSEPYHAGNVGGHSVWWTWTAPADGVVMLDTSGSNFDTLLAVYTGTSVSALTLVAANDDDPTAFTTTSRLAFRAVAGTTYHFAVDGYAGATGTIALHLAETVAPANDNFANAAALTGNTWTGSNIGATAEAGEPWLAGNPGGSSVWVNWTAPTTGTVSLSTAGSNFDTMLGVYTGSSVGALAQVAANDDASVYTLTSAVTFNAVAGTTYHIRIDGYNGAQGSIVLTLA
jgi:subtilase family serine protease